MSTMVTGLWGIAGLLIGLALNWLSEALPRTSASFDAAMVEQRDWPGLNLMVVGLSTAAAVALSLRPGSPGASLAGLLVTAFFLLVAVIDLKYRLVLNVLIYPALAITLLATALIAPQRLPLSLAGGLLAFGLFMLTATLRPGELGGGDIKLAALIGLLAGFPGVLIALLVGAGLGAITAAALMLGLHWQPRTHIPYAPFLCSGAIIALIFSPLTAIIG
jgi:prepilin signal peptidase PulO-like enzyme (type II secretory pathway)